MFRAVRAGAVASEPEVGAPADVLSALRARGACFRPELATLAGRLPAEVDEGLWDLVARGIVTADAFSAVRSCSRPATAGARGPIARRTVDRTRDVRPGPDWPVDGHPWARASGRAVGRSSRRATKCPPMMTRRMR